jgi:hypothetical protein
LLNGASTIVAVELKSINMYGLDEIPEISERFRPRLLKPPATNLPEKFVVEIMGKNLIAGCVAPRTGALGRQKGAINESQP